MELTTENAELYLGKKLDSHSRWFHYYPLKVTKTPEGKYMYVDRNGVAMMVPEPSDRFNRVCFDFVCGEEETI